jgi:hypothetical protein
MASPISRTVDRAIERGGVSCYQIHAAGIRPNSMNRFMQSNTHEVLFVT